MKWVTVYWRSNHFYACYWCFHSHLKSVLRYKFLTWDTYHLDTIFMWAKIWVSVVIFWNQKGSTSKKSLGKNGLGINARDFQFKGNSITPSWYLFFVSTYIYHYFTVFLKMLLIFIYIISMLIFNINIPFTKREQ
jgi:hypothetical protein